MSHLHMYCTMKKNGRGSAEMSHLHLNCKTRIDVYETLCPQQMLVHKGGKIKNWGGECRDVPSTKSLSQNIRVDVKTFFFFFLGGGGSGRGGGGGGEGVGVTGWM